MRTGQRAAMRARLSSMAPPGPGRGIKDAGAAVGAKQHDVQIGGLAGAQLKVQVIAGVQRLALGQRPLAPAVFQHGAQER